MSAAAATDPVTAAGEADLTDGLESSAGAVRTFDSLRIPAFRAWFSSQVVSASGSMTQSVGTSWLILQLTGRGIDLAILSAATMLPVLLGSPYAGTLGDRFDRRRLLIVTQSLFVLISGTLTVISAAGAARVWSLVLISVMTGCVMSADGPARQVYVMDLVGRDRLASAVSLYEVILNASRILGPALGGVLLAVSGPTACFAANTISFLPPLWVLWRFRASTSERAARERPPVVKGRTRAAAGYAFRNPLMRSCLLLAAASGVLFNASILFPLLATRAFHLSGGGYGALLGSFGIGALPGALAAARSGHRPSGRLVLVLAIGTGLTMAATSLTPWAPLAYVTMAATGFCSIWYIALANTLVQLTALPEMRGGVMGLWTMMLPGTGPVTAFGAAGLADLAGPRVAFAAAGGLIALAAISGWRGLTR